MTQDGRIALITSSVGTDARYELHTIDLAKRGKDGWKAQPLVTGFDHDWKLVDGMGKVLWFVTNQDAPRYRLVAVDLSRKKPEWRELVSLFQLGSDIVRSVGPTDRSKRLFRPVGPVSRQFDPFASGDQTFATSSRFVIARGRSAVRSAPTQEEERR